MKQRSRLALQIAIEAATLGVFWLACVATLRRDELIVGAAGVALSAAFCMFTIRTLPLHFRPALRDLAQIWRVPRDIVADLGVVGLVLLRSLLGRRTPSIFLAAPWSATADSGRATARRTLAIAGATLSPNCVAVGIDCKQGEILLHQVAEAAVPVLVQKLGSGEKR